MRGWGTPSPWRNDSLCPLFWPLQAELPAAGSPRLPDRTSRGASHPNGQSGVRLCMLLPPQSSEGCGNLQLVMLLLCLGVFRWSGLSRQAAGDVHGYVVAEKVRSWISSGVCCWLFVASEPWLLVFGICLRASLLAARHLLCLAHDLV